MVSRVGFMVVLAGVSLAAGASESSQRVAASSDAAANQMSEGQLKAPTADSKPLNADQQQVYDLEQRRLAAIGSGDVAALRGMLTDDYFHVHQVVQVDDREAYLQAIQKTPRKTERGPLTIRVYGNMAVVTGEQRDALVTPIPGVDPLRPTMSTQIVVRQNGRWRFAGTQSTPVIKPGDPATVPAPLEDMSKLTQSPLSAEQKVVASLDDRRAEAIANQDFDTLLKMMSPDYRHVYGGGSISDRDEYIKQLKLVPRSYTRGPLQVRMYGDSAIVSGWLINTARFPNKPAITYQVWCTQVAHRVNGQWQLVSQHMTPKLDMPKG